jgi:hypothetical protein
VVSSPPIHVSLNAPEKLDIRTHERSLSPQLLLQYLIHPIPSQEQNYSLQAHASFFKMAFASLDPDNVIVNWVIMLKMHLFPCIFIIRNVFHSNAISTALEKH